MKRGDQGLIIHQLNDKIAQLNEEVIALKKQLKEEREDKEQKYILWMAKNKELKSQLKIEREKWFNKGQESVLIDGPRVASYISYQDYITQNPK